MEDIEQLQQVLARLENAVAGPQVQAWLLQITDPAYGLTSSLLETFLANIASADLAALLLTLVRQLNSNVREQVLPQLKGNHNFAPAIVKYLTETPSAKLSEDAFILITEVFDSSNSQVLDQPAVVRAVFDALEFIQGKDVSKALVNILAGVSKRSTSLETNLVLAQCKEHKNARFFREILLYQVNRSDPVDMLNCMTCCADLLKYETTGTVFFYTNDRKVLADMMFLNLEDLPDGEVVKKTLEVFSVLYRGEEFLESNYRVDDLARLLNGVVGAGEAYSEETKTAASQLISELALE